MTDNISHQRHGRRQWLLWLALPSLLALGCSKVDLYSNLPEREANVMMAALLEEGISCRKEAGDEEHTWKLLVPTEDFSQAVNVLTDMGYPAEQRERMGQIFKRVGLVSSPMEDRIRYVYGLSEELAETLSRIDGVVDARVHVVLPNNDPFSEHAKPSSASVYIKHRDNVELSASRLQIKDLVAKSIEGLTPQNVEVFMDKVLPIVLPERTEPVYTRALGVTLDPDSTTRFWRLVGGLAIVAAINLALALWFAFRHHLPRLAWPGRARSTASHVEAAAS